MSSSNNYDRTFTPAGTYPILENLVPPSYEDHITNEESLLRLENICACAIVKNENSCQMLLNTPDHLHKTLWKAYLRDLYYYKPSPNEKSLFQLRLQELLYHWPYDEFNLKKIMPDFPESIDFFSHKYYDVFDSGGPFYSNQKKLLKFYGKVAKMISRTFTSIYGGIIFPEHHTHDIKIRKINLSGFLTFELGNLVDSVENMLCYRPIPSNKDDKILEITLDVCIVAGFYFDGVMNNLNIRYHCHKYYNFIIFKFEHISLTGPYETKDCKSLLKRLVKDGTKSLGLRHSPSSLEENGIVEEILKTEKNQRNLEALELFSRGIPSLDFLQYLRNLVHLDLSGNNLHGKLESLGHMSRGLMYLKLRHCDLTNTDLDHLIGSCHLETLLELNLSTNSFSYDINSNNYNLITLCQNLRNIIMLELGGCHLESWNSAEIELLVDSWKKLPNIVYLDLQGNKFSTHTISVHIRTLQENPSLRYLQLTLPTELIESDGCNAFYNQMNEEMNDMRSQLLYVEISVCPSDMAIMLNLNNLHGLLNGEF